MSADLRLDNKSAWNYFKQDKKFTKKIAVFYGLILLCIIPILNLIIAPIVSLMFSGYFINNTHIRIFKQDSPLPEWGDKKNLAAGFKIFVANLVICIPINILLFIFVKPMLTNSISDIFPAIIMLLILLLIPMLYYVIAVLVFSTNLKIKSFFNIKAIKLIISNDLFCSYLGKLFAYGILSALVMVVATITIVGSLAIPAIIFITGAAISDLQAQFVRHVFKIGQKR